MHHGIAITRLCRSRTDNYISTAAVIVRRRDAAVCGITGLRRIITVVFS